MEWTGWPEGERGRSLGRGRHGEEQPIADRPGHQAVPLIVQADVHRGQPPDGRLEAAREIVREPVDPHGHDVIPGRGGGHGNGVPAGAVTVPSGIASPHDLPVSSSSCHSALASTSRYRQLRSIVAAGDSNQ